VSERGGGPLLAVDGVSVRFGALLALSRVSLDQTKYNKKKKK
jgi:hypothetical protein